MSTDFADKEREFLQSLKADTGRDLGEWMDAIAAEGLPHRNDVIDWLRMQGFIFSRASWLERIHANGGRPIYLAQVPESSPGTGSLPARSRDLLSAHAQAEQKDGQEALPSSPARQTSPPGRFSHQRLNTQAQTSSAERLRLVVSNPGPRPDGNKPAAAETPVSPPSPPTAAQPATGGFRTNDAAGLAAAIASAKAYAPLAGFLLRQISGRVAEAFFVPRRGHVCLHRGGEDGPVFAVLALSARELRLALSLDEADAAPPFLPGRLTGAAQASGPGLAVVAALSDARQIDDAFLSMVAVAAQRHE